MAIFLFGLPKYFIWAKLKWTKTNILEGPTKKVHKTDPPINCHFLPNTEPDFHFHQYLAWFQFFSSKKCLGIAKTPVPRFQKMHGHLSYGK